MVDGESGMCKGSGKARKVKEQCEGDVIPHSPDLRRHQKIWISLDVCETCSRRGHLDLRRHEQVCRAPRKGDHRGM